MNAASCSFETRAKKQFLDHIRVQHPENSHRRLISSMLIFGCISVLLVELTE
jgi:hypothetical protein